MLKSAILHTTSISFGKQTPTFSSQSIYSPTALDYAAILIKKGKPIGLYNRGVCAILGNGADTRFVEAVRMIKGEKRGERALAATIKTKTLLHMLELTKIPASLHTLFTNADELSSRTASLCFLRVPITQDAARSLPKSMVSFTEDGTPFVQNWDPKGHQPAFRLLQKMQHRGIIFPAITSMNISGEPEIVNQKIGRDFSEENGLPLFLYDPKDKGDILGSYTILTVSMENGIELLRDGNIPGHLFNTLFETTINTLKAKKPNHPQKHFPAELIEGLHPRAARFAIIDYTQGKPITHIHRKLGIVTQNAL